MEDFEIPLIESEDGGELKTKNPDDKKFRAVLVQANRGDALTARASIAGITHGRLSRDGDLSTLIILEFRFISTQSSRRFTSCEITLKFDDVGGDASLHPEVYRIAPEGAFSINKTSRVQSVKQTANATVNAGSTAAGFNTGYVWEMGEEKNKENSTRLSGLPKQFGSVGPDDGVVWSMQENGDTKGGIPTFLRTAVLLRREADVPFSFQIDIHTDVDFNTEMGSKMKSFFGRKQIDEVDPVEIDSKVDPKLLRVSSLDPKKFNLRNMESLDLSTQAKVTIATLVATP